MFPAVHALDYNVSKWLVDAGLANHAFGFFAFVCAQLVVFVMAGNLAVMWYQRGGKGTPRQLGSRKAVILALMGVVFAIALKSLIVMVFLRERPFISHPDILALPIQVDPGSFPSAHAMVAAVIAFSLWFSRMPGRAAVASVLALLVGFGRVAVGVHYTTDVLAGFALAFLVTYFLHRESSSLKHYLPNE
ncbi:undecaprenyl-diphosphatase [soil metagenome]